MRAGGLETGVGERDGHVLHLPEEQPQVRHDDGRSEGGQGNPGGVLDEAHGQEDQTEADQVAEQRGAHQQAERDAAAMEMIAAAMAKLARTIAMP